MNPFREATIDLGAIADNVRHFRRLTGAEIIAVVKANAYGHGAAETAIAALAGGATRLGTATLDSYRGYTAQSRSQQPTHTWNTANLPTVDFGGRLAHPPDPDREVATALARIPDTTMAAVDDPWILDRQLRDLITAHQHLLDRQPPDRRRALAQASRDHEAAQTTLTAADAAVARTRRQLDDLAYGFFRNRFGEKRPAGKAGRYGLGDAHKEGSPEIIRRLWRGAGMKERANVIF